MIQPHKQCQMLSKIGYFTTIIWICILTACNTGDRSGDLLIGSWSNIDLEVLVNQRDPVDSVYTFEVLEGDWEQTLNIKPIVTEFRRDGSYRSEYRSLQDSVIREAEGFWKMDRDTLILIEDGTATSYHMELSDGKVTFRGWLDWDQDGKQDDLYSGRQKKI